MAHDAAQHFRAAVDAYKPSDELKAARKSLGWTQHDMADALDVRQATVSDWERGKYPPGKAAREKMREIADDLESSAPDGAGADDA